ncbi:MAG TPA: Asp23/Gls24 family envelope stress response protein [Candidatus Onthocola gallistercoris]|uniref:Asp23/Gls24 family envelope stress response protein n=1 Tax=Candidatus Onthocola gallistercoris TaxID=2840876 RepID=A0A9D1KXL6_9FIRM|nr:Asp23/Gls24 family envelope stress response protein [Candidatus Onthocola gallistercoris]
MKGHLNTGNGIVSIDLDVISRYAGLTAVECFGIVGMAMISMKDGLTKLLKRESLTKGVDVTIEDNKISIAFHVIIAYGVSIATVADNLMSNVKYKVEQFTGLEVSKVDIFVEGVRIID